jgi:hypothetical protein
MAGKTNIDPGVVARLAGQSNTQSNNPADNWFPPLAPMSVVAPKESPARVFDYATGVNLTINPRPDEAVTYEHMRFVAEECTLAKMAIETRKDQLGKQRWDIRYKPEEVEGKTSKQRKEMTAADPRLKEVRGFFRYPDKELPWDAWLRKLIHEVLVTDAPALEMNRTFGKKPNRLLIVDGTTITRKIALDGTTPQSPNVAYQQIIKGVPYAEFTTDELIFRPRNPRVNKLYGFSPTEQIIFQANMIMRRELSKLNYYTEGNLPPALASVSKDWSADQIGEFQAKFDAINQGDLGAMRRLQFIPEISNLYLLKEAVLKDDADEWFARLVMYAFSLPPTALTKQMNRATAEQAAESAEDEGLAPLMNWVSDLMTYVIEKFFGYTDLEFIWIQERILDPKEQADTLKILVDEGVMNRNQAAEKLGLDPIEGGDVYTVATSNGPIPLEEAVMSTADKQDAGIIPTPPKPGVPVPNENVPDPAPDKASGEPTVSPEKPDAKKTLRNEIAKHLSEIYEDLNPELRDPVIAAKLLELERNG